MGRISYLSLSHNFYSARNGLLANYNIWESDLQWQANLQCVNKHCTCWILAIQVRDGSYSAQKCTMQVFYLASYSYHCFNRTGGNSLRCRADYTERQIMAAHFTQGKFKAKGDNVICSYPCVSFLIQLLGLEHNGLAKVCRNHQGLHNNKWFGDKNRNQKCL